MHKPNGSSARKDCTKAAGQQESSCSRQKKTLPAWHAGLAHPWLGPGGKPC